MDSFEVLRCKNTIRHNKAESTTSEQNLLVLAICVKVASY